MKNDLPQKRKWHSLDWIVGAMLFLATAAFVFWQNTRIAVLWDLSYLLDTSWRIALGQMPYRDFPLVHPPLTFLIQAILMRLAGRIYLVQIAYAAIIGALATLIAWRILLRLLYNQVQYARLITLLLTAPLCVLGIYSIYPHPIYDCDSTCAVLLALLLLQGLSRSSSTQSGWRLYLMFALAGGAVFLPILFKQNIGLPFLLAVVTGVFLLFLAGQLNRCGFASLAEAHEPIPHPAGLLCLLAGIALAAALAVVLIQLTAGLGNYLHWTVAFAGQRRLPSLALMLSVYQQPSFVWTIPVFAAGLLLAFSRIIERRWTRLAAFACLSAPFVGSLIFLFLDDDLDERADNLLALWPLLLLASALCALVDLRKGITIPRLLPFFVLAAIHGTFLSQQLWGSTYAIWPLLLILVAAILAVLPQASGWVRPAFAAVVSATFLICGSLYAIGHERLSYIQQPNSPIQYATLPALRGLSVPGPFLSDFEELVRFAQSEIPTNDGTLFLPGEEPFYFATGRTPRFPIQIFDHTTDPYSPEELFQAARAHNIRWLILKTRLQSNENPLPAPGRTLELIQAQFRPFRQLAGYAVYCRP